MAGINPHPRFLLKESVYWSICVFFRSTLCERRKQNDKKAVDRGGRGGRGRCKTEEYRLLSYSLPYYTARAHTGLVHLRFWSFSHCCQGGRFPTVVRVAVFLLLSMVVAFPFRVAVFPLLSGVRVGFCVSDRTGTMATAEGEDCTGKNCPPPDSRLLLSFRQCGERTFLAVNLLPYFKTATILCVCVCVCVCVFISS